MCRCFSGLPTVRAAATCCWAFSCSLRRCRLTPATARLADAITLSFPTPVSSASLSLKSIPDRAGIPYLLLQAPWAGGAECIDYSRLSAFAVGTLLERYHTSIACLLSDGEEMGPFLEGYKKRLFDSGILPKDSLVFHEISPILLQKISSQLVSAVICSSYDTALELYGKLSALHYSIPRELSIIAMKDGQLQKLPFPAISCCPVPEYAFGKYLTAAREALAEHT